MCHLWDTDAVNTSVEC